MARGASGDDIVSELKAVASAMRELGILKYQGHGIEVLLGPEPIPPEDKKKKKEPDDVMLERRRHYELQLGRAVSDQELKYLP
jgi:hypothetical protein